MGRRRNRQQQQQHTEPQQEIEMKVQQPTQTEKLVAEAAQKQEQTPPPLPQDKTTEVAKAEDGFVAKIKNGINGVYTTVKGFFVNLWQKITNMFSKESLQANLARLKTVAGLTALAGLVWLAGSALITAFGLPMVIAGGIGLSVIAYGAKRYMDYSDEKKTNPNAKYEFNIVESINPFTMESIASLVA